jgi:hypothetical protein
VLTQDSTSEPDFLLSPSYADVQEPWEGFWEDLQVRFFFIQQFSVLIFSVTLTYFAAKLVGALPSCMSAAANQNNSYASLGGYQCIAM